MRAIVIALLLAACQHGEDPGGAAAQPTDAVRAFFAAIDAGACDKLDAAIAGTLAQSAGGDHCAHALDEYRRHRLRLGAVRGATADGRDPDAQIVRITVSRDGRDEDVQVRVERKDGAWRMTTF